MVMSVLSKKIPVIYCTSFHSRFIGLMFQKNIQKALCFPRCNSIHTFFMKEDIQVIVTSKEHIVLFNKIIKPWKILFPIKNGYYTYEFPISYRKKIKVGDIFKGF